MVDSRCTRGHILFDEDGAPTDNCHITAQDRVVCKACRRTGRPPGRPPRADGKDARVEAQKQRRRREAIKADYADRIGLLGRASLLWERPTRAQLELDLPANARMNGGPMPSAEEIEAYVQRELVRDMRAEYAEETDAIRRRLLVGDDPVLAAWAAGLEPVT